MSIGILLHVYHLEAEGWEHIVWGDPARDHLGTVPKFAELLLGIPRETDVTTVIYSGPSQKDSLTEGAYTKQLLVDRIDRLDEFPRLKKILDTLTPQEYDVFKQRLHALRVGSVIKNTLDEVAHAAREFADKDVDEAIQIASASHAARCIKAQLVAKENGLLTSGQLWSVMASDTYFYGTTAEDIVIVEPPHRGDDRMKNFHPTLSEALRPYFKLDTDTMKQLNQTIHQVTHPEK